MTTPLDFREVKPKSIIFHRIWWACQKNQKVTTFANQNERYNMCPPGGHRIVRNFFTMVTPLRTLESTKLNGKKKCSTCSGQRTKSFAVPSPKGIIKTERSRESLQRFGIRNRI